MNIEQLSDQELDEYIVYLKDVKVKRKEDNRKKVEADQMLMMLFDLPKDDNLADYE